MPDKIPNGYISKPDALSKYNKAERTFQRRLAKALRSRDQEFLSHFLLVTSDGKIREGIEVQFGTVQKLKNSGGLYPVWYLEETWFANAYDRKSKSTANEVEPTPITEVEPNRVTVEPHRKNLDRAALIAEIESLRRELEREKKHNNLITTQLIVKDEQIKASNKLAFESNAREKEFSNVLQQLAQRIPNTGDIGTTSQPQVVQTYEPESASIIKVVDSNPAAKKKSKAAPTKKTSTKKRKAAPRKSKSKKSRKEMFPTLSKLFNRS